jgi:hypothetical protein
LARDNPATFGGRHFGEAQVAAFIAYGRLFVRPIAPASISASAYLKGLVVLGALVLVDFAPLWYKLTHTH